MSYRERIYDKYASVNYAMSGVPDEAAMSRWGRPYDFFLKGWLPEDKNAAILDVACGSGGLLYHLKSRDFKNIQGVDTSPEQVALAKAVTDNVVEQDALAYLKSHVAAFDLIVGLDIVEHLRKDEVLDFLDACRDALRPSGRVVFQTPNAATSMGGSCLYGDFTHEVGLTPSCLDRLLRLVGFTDYQVRECGPVPHGAVSTIRFCLWQIIRATLLVYDFVEVGGNAFPIYTRVFLASAVKK